MSKLKKALPALCVVGAVVVALAFAEMGVAILLRFPSAISALPNHPRMNLLNLYFNRMRNNIQFDEKKGRWDSQLFYTLRPGTFTVSEVEYNVDFSVNSLGTRDEERALQDPDIIAIGDSFTMGWGVPQKLTFAKLIEQHTGLKTLNLGVSSYGTVRERMLLDRVKAKPKYLLIQYCDNDLMENAAYFANGNHYEARPEAQYHHLAAYNLSNTRYYPGKYLDSLLGVSPFASLFRYEFVLPYWEEPPKRSVDLDEGDLFLNALAHAGKKDLNGVQLIVFEMKALHEAPNFVFIDRLANKIQHGQYPDYIKRMIPADLSTALSADRFFVLDDHLNVSGHERVAFMLSQLISQHMRMQSERSATASPAPPKKPRAHRARKASSE